MYIGVIGLKGQQIAHLRNEFPGRRIEFLPDNMVKVDSVKPFVRDLDCVLVIAKATPMPVIGAIPPKKRMLLPGNVSVSSVARWIEQHTDPDELAAMKKAQVAPPAPPAPVMETPDAVTPEPDPTPAETPPSVESSVVELREGQDGRFNYELVRLAQVGDVFRLICPESMPNAQFYSRITAAKSVLRSYGLDATVTNHKTHADLVVKESAGPAPFIVPPPVSPIMPIITRPPPRYIGEGFSRLPNPMYDYSEQAAEARANYNPNRKVKPAEPLPTDALFKDDPAPVVAAPEESPVAAEETLPVAEIEPSTEQRPLLRRDFLKEASELWRQVVVARVQRGDVVDQAVVEADRVVELYRTRFNDLS